MVGQRRLLFLLGTAALLLLPGCFSVFYSDPVPPADAQSRCKQIDPICRGKLFVFMLNGLDPFNSDNLGWTRDYLKGLGFAKVYSGQSFHEDTFFDEIIRLHNIFDDARFVVIGSDTGAEAARSLVQKVGDKNVPVEMLIYLQPRGLEFATPSVETPVARIINVQGRSIWTKDAAPLEGTQMLALQDTSPYGVARHPELLAYLTEQLTGIAEHIPRTLAPTEAFPAMNADDLPIYPRNIQKKKVEPLDEWDFLKPASEPKIRDTNSTKHTDEPPIASKITP
jgi:hypothetical protein